MAETLVCTACENPLVPHACGPDDGRASCHWRVCLTKGCEWWIYDLETGRRLSHKGT